jgi:hypothetical protein
VADLRRVALLFFVVVVMLVAASFGAVALAQTTDTDPGPPDATTRSSRSGPEPAARHPRRAAFGDRPAA